MSMSWDYWACVDNHRSMKKNYAGAVKPMELIVRKETEFIRGKDHLQEERFWWWIEESIQGSTDEFRIITWECIKCFIEFASLGSNKIGVYISVFSGGWSGMVASRLLICIPSETLALRKPADSHEDEYLDVFFLMEKQPKSIGKW
jgi:hypothetical protein